ncbi:U6 snRNA-associated Sm-like protein LSm7 [Terfezia boudieri ATCC MYA-4762]|uniref:U6 snRNA-associated Sm-like protein LSm7 n=1 Tax=Terfezia boudieri ATCC MYA-4762 TaxID=1051890 RepID=A0A3N4L9D3_9PEZI|nr:U6 snRNA-associated Sm-like protein LSm7 [Terfezia boudieri ATCC MYA-4762]
MDRGRGGFRGRGGNRGDSGGRGGGRGGYQGNRQGGEGQGDRKPREAILDLGKYLDKAITVKFTGGREVIGVLKGYDQLMNLVLDDVKETFRDEDGNEQNRELGLVVARGPMLTLISPIDGSEQIANPFLAAEMEASGATLV